MWGNVQNRQSEKETARCIWKKPTNDKKYMIWINCPGVLLILGYLLRHSLCICVCVYAKIKVWSVCVCMCVIAKSDATNKNRNRAQTTICGQCLLFILMSKHTIPTCYLVIPASTQGNIYMYVCACMIKCSWNTTIIAGSLQDDRSCPFDLSSCSDQVFQLQSLTVIA